ncbi:rhomboid family intramembrane serine protease [Clostridium lundense]|uniref:rhomboid family intramembrane serine protease n=1 Tax=Clostridium lundense TaxID=319475 RepID=UPI0004800AA6|nr:rhomboid family intramembrane serine protease [Clostridium lundense]
MNQDNIIKFVVENATRGLGYNLIEFNDSCMGIISPWVLIKQEDMGISRCIIFCNEEYENIDDYWIKLNLKDYSNTDYLNVLKIVFTQNEERANIKIHNIIQGQSMNNLQMQGYIFLDMNVGKVLYYTSGNEELVSIIGYYLNEYNMKEKNISTKNNRPILTYILIGINIFMYIITALLSGNIIDSNINVLVFLGAKVNPLIQSGEYYRLLTCTFLHGGIIHLGLNMYALYALGPSIESIYGRWKYILIYIISGITSSILSYFLSDSISIGASGAIFGLLGAYLIIAFKLKDQVGKNFVSNIISVIFVNLIIGFSVANVDNFGHIGGLIGGVIVSALVWK